MMYGSSSSREICVNECPRKEWRGGREKTKDKEQSSKGSVDKPQDLEEPKERKRKGRGTCRHQVGPKQAGHGGEHGYKGGRYVGLARARWHGARP